MASKNTFPHIDWKKYLFEMLVIITGISISFMVQNWQESRQAKRTVNQVLAHILEDLEKDSVSIFNEIKTFDKLTEGMKKVMRSKEYSEISDSVELFVATGLLNYSTVIYETIGYQSMLQFGVLKNMDNKQLANDILHLYTNTYQTLNELYEIDKTLVLEQFIPLFTQRFPYAKKFTELQVKNDVVMNSFAIGLSIKEQLIDAYKQSLEEVDVLSRSIKKELYD